MNKQKKSLKECANPACNNLVKSNRSVFCSHPCYTDYERNFFRKVRDKDAK